VKRFFRNNHNHKTLNAFTLVEVMITAAIVALAMFPLFTMISNTVRQTYEMNAEIAAELIAKNILDQIVKSVPFDKVTDDITVGAEGNSDVKLVMGESGQKIDAKFSGNKTGSIISFGGAEFKWEINVYNITAVMLPLSFRMFDGGWPSDLKGTKDDALRKSAMINGDVMKADCYTLAGDQIVLKTIKLKMSWRINGDIDDFTEPRRKFMFVTRKAQLDETKLNKNEVGKTYKME